MDTDIGRNGDSNKRKLRPLTVGVGSDVATSRRGESSALAGAISDARPLSVGATSNAVSFLPHEYTPESIHWRTTEIRRRVEENRQVKKDVALLNAGRQLVLREKKRLARHNQMVERAKKADAELRLSIVDSSHKHGVLLRRGDMNWGWQHCG